MEGLRVCLDNIVFSLQKTGGISVVWFELLKRIMDDPNISELKLLEYLNAVDNIFRRELNVLSDFIINQGNKPFLRRYLNPFFNFEEKTIFHSSYYRICTGRNALNVTTVHDFTYEKYSKGIKKEIHCWQKFKAIRSSDIIICISNNTKRDLLHYMPDVDISKIRVIYNGVSDDYCLLRESGKNLPFEEKSYVLFVGARQGYKNFRLAIEAISNSLLNFVIVGKNLSNEEIYILEKYLPQRYKLVNGISNKELNILYNGAFCLLYPSSYEGFGIPVLEAQRCGCPVIAYKGSSIPEIVGENDALLISQINEKQIMDKFKLLENSKFREQIIQDGVNNSLRFSWDNSYKRIISVYEELLY